MKQIPDIRTVAIYGKGGIGKSTIASNLSAALSHMDEKVMQIGCDPKRDSVALLCGGLKKTILECLDDGMSEEIFSKVIHRGYNGIYCIESGGPKPGSGCAGRGVAQALGFIEQYKVFENYGITFALFDVLGDVVCGGFAQPVKDGFAKQVYLVTSGEILSILQMNNVCMSIISIAESYGSCTISGIINNMRGVPHEEEIVEEISGIMGLPVIIHIPRSHTVQNAELEGKTVIEAYPEDSQAKIYRDLAAKILSSDPDETFSPNPLSLSEIKNVIKKYMPSQGYATHN